MSQAEGWGRVLNMAYRTGTSRKVRGSGMWVQSHGRTLNRTGAGRAGGWGQAASSACEPVCGEGKHGLKGRTARASRRQRKGGGQNIWFAFCLGFLV